MRDSIRGPRRASIAFHLLVLVVASCFAVFAQAATITARNIPDMGCNLLLEGVIDEGDADRLRQQIHMQDRAIGATSSARGSPHGRRLCLNSPGGSFRGGLQISDLLRELGVGTAVPANSSCESACALAFMGGVFFPVEGEGTWRVDRLLHPRGRLGFHAPSITLPDGGYSAAQVAGAYALALQNLATIVEMRSSGYLDFPESLLVTFLRTPPGHLHYIETVGAAARLGITIAPVGIASESLP